MVVENIFHAQRFERQRYQEDVIRRIAALNDVKAAPEINPPGKYEFAYQRPAELDEIARTGCLLPLRG